MEITLIVLIILLLASQVVFGFFLFRKKQEGAGEDSSFLMLQQQLQDFNRTMDEKVQKMGKDMHDSMYKQASDSQKLIKDITEEITSVKELGRQTATFAEQLKSLQDVLKNPKQRGVLGEYYLETVLKNVLPPGMYKMQYGFDNGEIVDAVVFVKDRVIPIDSKFSLENYNRLINENDATEKANLEKVFINDLKLRIKETSKYIRPQDGTMDFAFMFIPSEGIYYDLLVNTVGGREENLIQTAAAKYKVIIVSPTSFLAYLQTVLQGLNALQIEQKAQEIQKRVGELGRHIDKYEEFYKKLGTSLGTTVSHYNSAYKELKKVDKDVFRISEYNADIEPESLDKPNLE